jgi:hypothetical protein
MLKIVVGDIRLELQNEIERQDKDGHNLGRLLPSPAIRIERVRSVVKEMALRTFRKAQMTKSGNAGAIWASAARSLALQPFSDRIILHPS